MRVSNKTKQLMANIRREIKNLGYSNRSVGVTCKVGLTKLTTEKEENIYIIVTDLNVNAESVEKIYQKYKKAYGSKVLHFLFLSIHNCK